MDHTTLTALEGSIKKWEAIAAGTGTDEGTRNCPLCLEFAVGGGFCIGCPVYEHTGQMSCDGTPYEEWSEGDWFPGKTADTPELKQQAQAMLDFLKSLLPDNSEK